MSPLSPRTPLSASRFREIGDRRTVMRRVLIGSAGAVTVAFFLYLAVRPAGALERAQNYGAIILLNILLYALLQRGYIRVVSFAYVAITLVSGAIGTLWYGGVNSTGSVAVLSLGVFSAGLAFGRRMIAAAAVFGAVWLGGIFWLQQHGYDLGHSELADSFAVALTVLATFTAVVAIANHTLTEGRKERVRLLQASEDVIRALQEGVAVVDAAGRIERVNPAFLRMVHQPALGVLGQTVEATLGRRNPEGNWNISANGARLELSATQSRLADGGQVWVFRDIGPEKAVERGLREAAAAAADAHDAKSRFLANVSHELRTPIDAVLGYGEIIHEATADPILREDAGRMLHAGRHLLAVINDMVDLSKIELGRLEFSKRNVDVASVIGGVVDVVRLNLRADVVFRVQVTPDLAVYTDPVRLRQILIHIVSNAVKFTDNGTVLITAERARGSDRVAILVADTGAGISDDTLVRLFQPFTQADPSSSRRHGGAGLGLALSRQLARLLGGDLQVMSAVGLGTTLSLELPLGEGAEVEATTPGLLVVGDPAVARLLERLLSGIDECVTIADPGVGLARIRDLRPKAVLWRIDNDWDRAEAVVALCTELTTPVALLTTDTERAAALGARAVSTQLGRAALADLVHELLGRPRPSVLVIDDDDDLREIAVHTLLNAGFSVREAASGQAALDAFAHHCPDIALLDLMMPEVDGFAVLAAIRAHHVWKTTRVVVFTAAELDASDRARLQTADAVVEKGTEPLLRVLAAAMAPAS